MESTNHIPKQTMEKLRQERETFEQHKSHEDRWFVLRLVMGYTAVILLFAIIGICVYIFFNYTTFPTAIVTAASAAFFVDVVGLVITVWKIVFNPDFITKLAPVTQNMPSTVISEKTIGKPTEGEAKTKEITILSAKYGKGETTVDVTEILKTIVSAAATGDVRFTVNNKTFASEHDRDPARKKEKDLNITYIYAGETRTITVHEYEELSLP